MNEERDNQQPEKQTLAENPNPRANENIKGSKIDKETSEPVEQTGSEITDGEDG